MPEDQKQSPTQLVQGCLIIIVLGAVIIGACTGIVVACTNGDDSPSAPAPRRPTSSGSSGGTSSSSGGSGATLTTFDRECLRWARISGNDGGLSDLEVRANYDDWRRGPQAACRQLRFAARDACSAMEEAGLDHRNDDDLHLALTTFLNPADYEGVAAAVIVWCD